MTCVVGVRGKNGVVLAGDTQSSFENANRNMRDAKTCQLSDLVATAYTGYGRLGQILEYHLVDLQDPGLGRDEMDWAVREFIPYFAGVLGQHGYLHTSFEDSVEGFGLSAFLLAVRNRLFVVEPDFGVSEHKLAWDAMGSGMEAAAGALSARLGQAEYADDDKLTEIAHATVVAAADTTNFVGFDVTQARTVLYTDDELALARKMIKPPRARR